MKYYSERIYVKIPRKEIGYFKFILESYENLCYMSVIDRYDAIIKISFFYDQIEQLMFFLKAIKKDIGLEIVFCPDKKIGRYLWANFKWGI